MDAVREQLDKPLVVGIIGFIVGVFIGLVVLGWGLFPVRWSDAAPEQLREDLQSDYMRMAIDSYALNRDIERAKTRFEELGADAEQILNEIELDPVRQSDAAIFDFRVAVKGGIPSVGAETPEVGEPTTESPSSGRTFLGTVLPILCVLSVLIAGGLGAFFIYRSRTGEGIITPAIEAQDAARQAEQTDYEAIDEEPPIKQFVASYKLGDDLFDDSESIDSPSGEFLGECGVGISETIGVGDPKKVTAFEVWLFDKNDIQTVTKVVMSAHAYLDEDTRQRLVAKGEPVLAEPGTETVLETQTLQLVARVVDMAYGEGATPEQSFFDRLVLEIAVWPKS